MSERKAWLLLISLLFAIGLLLPSGPVGADDPIPTPVPGEPAEWSTGTVTTAKVAPKKIERPSKGNPKLESSLNQLLEAHRREGLAEAQAFATSHSMVLQDDRVQVKIVTTEEAIGDVREAVEAVGGEYQIYYRNLLQALVPISELEVLAERRDVQIIREPQRAIPLAPMQVGSQTTEGVAASNASAWHAAGHTGSGVRVAVIDGGFTDYSTLLGTDLPSSVTTYDWTGTGMGGSSHGTACAEIVYDMAYGAAMDLHKISSDVELGNAVTQAIADGVDIISMSLGWTIDGPGDGTGNLANIVNNARANGIFFAVAAGNEAEVSWSGTYTDNDSDTVHEWDASGQELNYFGSGDGSAYYILAGSPIVCGLHWDDWTGAGEDYDLELHHWSGSSWSLVGGSYNDQAGGYPTPEEFIQVAAPTTGIYAVVVLGYSTSRDCCLSLNCPKMIHLDEWVPERSLSFPADSLDAITVGAVNATTHNLEPYSSQGPTFGSGGICSGGSTKPDIAAYAWVSTVSYGLGWFNGTSAATPHVAGAAALLKEAYPSYSVSQLQNYLETNAVDLGAPGKDSLYGAGRLYLGDPLPDVKITKRVLGSDLKPGDSVTFTLTIQNIGAYIATNVVVSDTMPVEIINLGWTADAVLGAVYSGPPIYKWDLNDLTPAASGIITITGNIAGTWDEEPIPNTAEITAAEDYNISNNRSTATVGVLPVYLPIILKSSTGADSPFTFEDQLISLINAERSSRGLGTLSKSSTLMQVAEAHSQDMVDRNFFSHTHPDGLGPGERLTNAGYNWTAWGETIGAGYSTPQSMFDGWMNNSEHRDILLDATYTEIGVGYVAGGTYGHYWTGLFAKPAP